MRHGTKWNDHEMERSSDVSFYSLEKLATFLKGSWWRVELTSQLSVAFLAIKDKDEYRSKFGPCFSLGRSSLQGKQKPVEGTTWLFRGAAIGAEESWANWWCRWGRACGFRSARAAWPDMLPVLKRLWTLRSRFIFIYEGFQHSLVNSVWDFVATSHWVKWSRAQVSCWHVATDSLRLRNEIMVALKQGPTHAKDFDLMNLQLLEMNLGILYCCQRWWLSSSRPYRRSRSCCKRNEYGSLVRPSGQHATNTKQSWKAAQVKASWSSGNMLIAVVQAKDWQISSIPKDWLSLKVVKRWTFDRRLYQGCWASYPTSSSATT